MNGVANRSGSAATIDAGRSARTDRWPVWILIGLCLLGLTVPEAARAVEANDPGMPPVKIMASGGRTTTPPVGGGCCSMSVHARAFGRGWQGAGPTHRQGGAC